MGSEDGGSIGSSVPSILPLTDEQAKAVQSLSSFGETVVTESSQLVRYVGRVLGTIPEDAVGVVLGDPLHFVRTAIAAQYDKLLTKILKDRNVTKTQPVSPSLAIPLLRAAYDESRPALQELWAALIAAAMDPARSGRVRLAFIDTLKRFDPLDAVVLKARYFQSGELRPNPVHFIAQTTGEPQDEIQVSVDNLRILKCVDSHGSIANFFITNYGNALVRACCV